VRILRDTASNLSAGRRMQRHCPHPEIVPACTTIIRKEHEEPDHKVIVKQRDRG
jgi:hypothetical protein